MLKDKRILIAVLLITLVSLACAMPFGNDSASPKETNLLFEDDFSDSSSGWDQFNQPEGITDYTNGIYRIFVNAAQVDYWANPGLNFTDIIVSVEATKVAGPDDNDFGVICRYKDQSNFYFFLASSDGFYAIGRMIEGSQELLGEEQLLPTDAIVQGNSTNTVEASCIGNQLTLTINGETITTVEDRSFTEGDVGLIAGTYDSLGTDIHFDNFKVMKP